MGKEYILREKSQNEAHIKELISTGRKQGDRQQRLQRFLMAQHALYSSLYELPSGFQTWARNPPPRQSNHHHGVRV